jgi:predicted O-methyltransferase YrrM
VEVGSRAPRRDLDHISAVIDQGWRRVSATTGYLSEREARFVMAAAALAPAQGKNLEIGSFKGRSTVGIAYVTRELGLGTVVAVDPHTSPATTDPDLKGKTTSYEDFVANLKTAGVLERVEIKRVYSHDLAREWKDSIRFLWIDGDHTYKGAKADVDMFKPYLVDGAIVAMHDVLGTFEGALRVFVEEILDSDDFGPAGFSGSIGWAQYRPRDGGSARFRRRRGLLAVPARRLIPVAQRADHGLHGWNKFLYKFWRPLAPHGDVSVARLDRLISE